MSPHDIARKLKEIRATTSWLARYWRIEIETGPSGLTWLFRQPISV